MKFIPRFLLIALALISVGAHASPVATTAGSNLTAYNPAFGAANNNSWNNMTNPRSGSETAPTADFGNCNALILRCAQPKCSNGGCTDMDVTSAIVNGCVNSNDACRQYGADLVNYISAQLVAQSTAQANQAAAAAQNAAAQQNSQQLAQMQQQMQQQMASLQQQIADSNANMQAAIEAQQQAATQANAGAASANSYQSSYGAASAQASDDITDLTASQRVAIESGVSEDLIMRETISGEILTQIENAEKSLKTLEQTMQTVFKYAGCDRRGDNCTGPKRVKKFKDLAGEFFDPYEDVLDDLYEAIYLAQTVGVDVSNIYMMLNNSCERWAKYTCSKPMYSTTDKDGKPVYVWPRYNDVNCSQTTGKSVAGALIEQTGNGNVILGSVRGGLECNVGQTIPPEDDTSCTAIQILSGDSAGEVARGFLYPDEGDMGDMVRVGCASNALKGSWLFRGKKQQASIDIETLRRIVEQDSAQVGFARQSKNALGQQEQLKYCALTESGYMNLQKYVGLRGLPTRNICVSERQVNQNLDKVFVGESDSIMAMAEAECTSKNGDPAFSRVTRNCYCYNSGGLPATGSSENDKCDKGQSEKQQAAAEKAMCKQFGVDYNNGHCHCDQIKDDETYRELCETRFEGADTTGASAKSSSGSTSGGGLKINVPGFDVGNALLLNCDHVTVHDTTCCECKNGIVVKKSNAAASCNNNYCY